VDWALKFIDFMDKLAAKIHTFKIALETVPGFVPHFLPFAAGGTVPGPYGAPQLAIVHGGERIIPTGIANGGGNGGDMTEVAMLLRAILAALTQSSSDGTGAAAALFEAIQRATNNRNRGMAGALL